MRSLRMRSGREYSGLALLELISTNRLNHSNSHTQVTVPKSPPICLLAPQPEEFSSQSSWPVFSEQEYSLRLQKRKGVAWC